MIYCSTITEAANTAEADATKTTLEVSKGLIWLIEVEFPAGCCGLVHVQIFDKSYQVFPATSGESLRGEAVVVSYDDLYLKNSAPFELTIRTWNTDELYAHTVQVRVGMATSEAFMSRYMPSVTWEKFNEVLAKAALAQEAERERQLKEVEKIREQL